MTLAAVISVLLAILVTGLSQQPDRSAQLPVVTGDRSIAPHCAPATDEQYGLTPQKPVQVGGGPVYGAARQRRYLDALRGPAGQQLRYKRRGSSMAPDGITILDAYDVEYEGAEHPFVLYLDWYHFGELRSPRGFVCGAPIGLGPPPPDPFVASNQLVSLAFEQGATRDFSPISLDPDGSAVHGIILDRFRLLARKARAAATAGQTLDSKSAAVMHPSTIVVAYPIACENQTIAAATIDIIPRQGPRVPHDGDDLRGEALAAMLPGISLPAGSVAAGFGLTAPRSNDTIRITYAAPTCGSTSTEASYSLKQTPPRTIDAPSPLLPPGTPRADAPVLLQVIIDLDGVAQRPAYIGGPEQLVQPAQDAVRSWKAEPARLNGAPMPISAMLQVKFR